MADKKNAKGKKKEKDGKGKTKPGKRPPGQGVIAPRPTPPAPTENGETDADPPIIISGGSVRIASAVFLDVSYDYRTRRFIYSTDDVKIGKIKTRGKKDEEDESDDGKFTIKLFKG